MSWEVEGESKSVQTTSRRMESRLRTAPCVRGHINSKRLLHDFLDLILFLEAQPRVPPRRRVDATPLLFPALA